MSGSGKQLPEHVTETVEQLARLHAAAEEGLTRRQRSVELVADRLGSPVTTYAIACGVLAWVGLNVNRRDSLAEAMTEAIDPDAMATAFRETIEAAGQDSPADASSSVDAAFAPQVRQPGSRSTADRVASARKKE